MCPKVRSQYEYNLVSSCVDIQLIKCIPLEQADSKQTDCLKKAAVSTFPPHDCAQKMIDIQSYTVWLADNELITRGD